MHNSPLRYAGIGLLTLVLSGCLGGGSDSNDSDNDSAQSASATPSLGLVTNATVNFYRADGTTPLGSDDTGSDGVAEASFSGYSGPMVIELVGDNDAQYYDEALGSMVAFGPGETMRAIVPSASGSFGVTPLTELAYQEAQTAGAFPLSATTTNQYNEQIRAALAPEVGDLLTPPHPFDGNTTAGSLPDSDAGRYALKLAALAKLGANHATPALAVMRALAADISDGTIDGQGSGGAVNAPYNPASFAADLGNHVSTVANGFASAGLRTASAGFQGVNVTVRNSSTGGGGGGGGNTGGGCTTACQQFFATHGGQTLAFTPDTTSLKAALATEFDGQASYDLTISSSGTLVINGDATAYTFGSGEITQFEEAAHETNAIYNDAESGYKVIFQRTTASGDLMLNIAEPYTQGANIANLANATLDHGVGGNTGGGNATPASGPVGGNILGSALNLNGDVTTLAGDATIPGNSDGTGNGATFNYPGGLTTDGTFLYVVEEQNGIMNKGKFFLRKIEIASGTATTLTGPFSGGGTLSYDGTDLLLANGSYLGQISTVDGSATQITTPGGTNIAALTTDGTYAYYISANDSKVRRIDLANGNTTEEVVADLGTITQGVSLDGITTDGANLYVVSGGANEVYKVEIASGNATTLGITLQDPIQVATDGTHLYITKLWQYDVVSVPVTGGTPTAIAGSVWTSGFADGNGPDVRFAGTPGGSTGSIPNAFGATLATDGTSLFVADHHNHVIRQID